MGEHLPQQLCDHAVGPVSLSSRLHIIRPKRRHGLHRATLPAVILADDVLILDQNRHPSRPSSWFSRQPCPLVPSEHMLDVVAIGGRTA
jgi:hypothetical protein